MSIIRDDCRGRDEIRRGLAEYYKSTPASGGTVNQEQSGFVLHTTGDPDTFIVEIDAVLETETGPTTMSLVQIFRLRDGEIAQMRDYFDPKSVS